MLDQAAIKELPLAALNGACGTILRLERALIPTLSAPELRAMLSSMESLLANSRKAIERFVWSASSVRCGAVYKLWARSIAVALIIALVQQFVACLCPWSVAPPYPERP